MKAIIPAAWYGTRMLPITKSVPKELLPIGNKAAIQYVVEWIVSSGIKDIMIITAQWKNAIEDYFDKNYELEEILKKKWENEKLKEISRIKEMANYCFVKQKEQLWFPHAILNAQPWMSKEHFLLTVSDEIFHWDVYREIVQIHQKTGKPVIALQETPLEEVSKYWIVKIKDWKIIDMIEKPTIEKAPSNLRMIWLYILPWEIFEIIRNTPLDKWKWEILLPDSLKILMKSSEIIPYITTHKWWDIWTPWNWLKANIEMANINM